MRFKEYTELLGRIINEGAINYNNVTSLLEKLSIRDNYSILFRRDYAKFLKELTALPSFALNPDFEKGLQGQGCELLFTPGTVLVDCEQSARNIHVENKTSEIGKAFSLINNHNIELCLHPYQGLRGPKGWKPYPGKKMPGVHDDFAMALAIRDLINLAEKNKIPAIIPGRFFYNPAEENLEYFVVYDPCAEESK